MITLNIFRMTKSGIDEEEVKFDLVLDDGRNWQVFQIVTNNRVVCLSFSTGIVVQLSK